MNMLDVIDHEGGIRELRLARPPVNALNAELLRRIADAVEGAAGEVAIVITGQPGLFSAGLDVRSMLELDRAGIENLFEQLWHAMRGIAGSRVPVIFGLTGHSPAGGTVLAINGDYRVMAQGEFRLGLNEVQVGLIPGPPINTAFRRLVGGHAEQLLTRGALIDPATALRMGLVDEVAEVSQVAARALAVARELAGLPRGPMLRTRTMVRENLVGLYGVESYAAAMQREFVAMGTEMWFAPEAQSRLRALFPRR
jgi:Delta3-Delta2-enoyl-CoA isomerase